jgi:sec-independent protein translocase protein TatC
MRNGKSMSFLGHLADLRKRLIRILVVLAVAGSAGLLFAGDVIKLMLIPYGSPLKVIGPTEGVANYIRVALACGAAAAMPYIVWELWGFASPGLLKREKRAVYALVPSAFAAFLSGAAFAWFVLIPAAVRFLAGFGAGIFTTEWTSQNYVKFVASLVFWIGAGFELPIVVYFLARVGIVGPRFLLRGWRWAVVLICVFAAVITPTVDPFNMMLVAVPLIGLYFAGIGLAALARGNGKKETLPR